MKALSRMVAAATLVVSSSAMAAPLELAPSTHWNLDYDDQACRLARTFGSGDDAVNAIFAKYEPGVFIEVMLSGKRLQPRGSKLAYRFGKAGPVTDAFIPLFSSDRKRPTVWQFSASLVPEKELGKPTWRNPNPPGKFHASERMVAADVETFDLVSGVDRPISLKLGELTKPLAAMDTCLDDLVSSWGFDPAVQRTLASPPIPKTDPGRWIIENDYPMVALRKAASGVVRFRLDVDAEGSVTRCTVQGAFSDPSFEGVTCNALLRRARFDPARDARGNAIPSYWADSVVFTVDW